MTAVLDAVVPVFGLILLGYAAARLRVLGPAVTGGLNEFLVWLALPALLFQAMATVKAGDLSHVGFAASFWAGMIVIFGLSLLTDRRPGRRLADRSIEALDAAYPNTGFMGIPLGLAVFGQEILTGLVVATLLTTCGLFAIAVGLIEFDLQAGQGLGRTVRKLAKALAKNPLVAAPVLGGIYALTGLPLPLPVLRSTTLLGAAASPCALVTIGLFLAQSEPGAAVVDVARLVGLKLIVQPGVTAGLAFGLFDMPHPWAKAAVVLAALPTGTGPFMLAKLYDRAAAVTSRAILVSTVLSVGTVSLLVAWL